MNFRNKKIFGITLAGYLLVFFIIVSCATTQSATDTSSTNDSIPSWLEKVPVDSQYYYFIGSASEVKSISDGEKIAFDDAITKVFALIGQNITSEYTKTEEFVESESSSYTSVLNTLIKAEAKGKIKNFTESDRFIQQNKNSLTLYILYKVPKATIVEEQNRLKSLYEEELSYFIMPEQKAFSLIEEGQYWSAFIGFITSAKNVASTQYENKSIVFGRNMDNAIRILTYLSSELNAPQEILNKSQVQNKPFVYSVYYTNNAVKKPVPNIPVNFFVPEIIKNTISMQEYKTVTDENGNAFFSYKKIPYAGSLEITAQIDILTVLYDLKKASGSIKLEGINEKFSAIATSINSFKKTVAVNAVSKTLKNKTLLAFHFKDETNETMIINSSSIEHYFSALEIPFSKKNVDENFTPSTAFEGDTERIVYIKGSVVSQKEISGKFSARISITIEIRYKDSNIPVLLNKEVSYVAASIKESVILSYKKALEEITSNLIIGL